jgi:hypothetical protein
LVSLRCGRNMLRMSQSASAREERHVFIHTQKQGRRTGRSSRVRRDLHRAHVLNCRLKMPATSRSDRMIAHVEINQEADLWG